MLRQRSVIVADASEPASVKVVAQEDPFTNGPYNKVGVLLWENVHDPLVRLEGVGT
jgi:hypothetical protein